jgi:superfamily II DNA or RNA helicase
MTFDRIWKTNATCREQLYRYEKLLHNGFYKLREYRNVPGDSEWFNFTNIDHPLSAIDNYIASLSDIITRRIDPDEVIPKVRECRWIKEQIQTNVHFIEDEDVRNKKLCEIQEPIIQICARFFTNAANIAGQIILPCATGKTRISCLSLHQALKKRIIVCCPSQRIQEQWEKTLQIISNSTIWKIGGDSGITNIQEITHILQKTEFCVISTYKSSDKIEKALMEEIDLSGIVMIFDEAHHMVGKIAVNDDREGITRRLMKFAVDHNIKRLSLTFTPRYVMSDDAENELSMDDKEVFGEVLYELSLRQCIEWGILPDYYIWIMHDGVGKYLLAKAECIIETLKACHCVDGIIVPYFNHLIIFARCIDEMKYYAEYLAGKVDNVKVITAQGGDDIGAKVAEFENTERAILLNCFTLGEGVDIPCADAVAIMYSKESHGQIAQMILRAGRWMRKKERFHVLIPSIGDDDMQGIKQILLALAQYDAKICDEMRTHSKLTQLGFGCSGSAPMIGSQTEHIVIEQYNSRDVSQIHNCFVNIHKNWTIAHIKAICREKHVDTSIDYYKLREIMTELPENPLNNGQTWYDFLHCGIAKITREVFHKYVVENRLNTADKYTQWRNEMNHVDLPKIQHINDGYFGGFMTNYSAIVPQYAALRR